MNLVVGALNASGVIASIGRPPPRPHPLFDFCPEVQYTTCA
jgi:hypothetical protein